MLYVGLLMILTILVGFSLSEHESFRLFIGPRSVPFRSVQVVCMVVCVSVDKLLNGQ